MKAKNIFYIALMSLIITSLISSCGNSGKTGSLTWKLKNGTLTISGQGAMPDYVESPWFWKKETINTIIIEPGVTSIGKMAFYVCESLTSITIPNTVTSIGEMAFLSCESLTSITIPNSVISIGASSFEDCKNLTSVTIPNSITSIENLTFARCESLNSITIPNSVTSIGIGAFYDCSSLSSVTIPDGITSIEESTFEDCKNLTSVTIGKNVTEIASKAFVHCSIRVLNILSSNPPVIYFDSFYVLEDAQINIPKGSESKYKNHSVWKYKLKTKLTEDDKLNIIAEAIERSKKEEYR